MNDSPGRTPAGGDRARADSGGGYSGYSGHSGYGGGGPGGHWGGPQWPRTAPPAPQPGVIPLRPLNVGEILDGTIGTMRRHWQTVLGVSLAVALGTQAVATAVTGIWFRESADLSKIADPQTTSLHEMLHAFEDSLPGMTVTSLVGLVGSIIAAAMLTVVFSRAVLGRAVTAGDTWRGARPQLPALTGLFCLVPLLILVPFAVCLAPGLIISGGDLLGVGGALTLFGGLMGMAAGAWIWTRYSLAAPALMLEKQGVTKALRRSAKLVDGAGWRVFGIQSLASFIVFMAGAIVQIPVSIIESILMGGSNVDAASWTSLIFTGVSTVISTTFTLPITAGVTALLYMDQRIRRESLDIELAQAAAAGGGA